MEPAISKKNKTRMRINAVSDSSSFMHFYLHFSQAFEMLPLQGSL